MLATLPPITPVVLQMEKNHEPPEPQELVEETPEARSIVTPTPVEVRQSSSSSGKLRQLQRLYGHADEQKTIRDAYQRAIQSTDEANLVVVKGGAGSGKTAVAQSLQEHVIEDGGFFITWKFYHGLQIGESDGFVDAFTSLTNQILAAGEEVLREIRTSLQALGKMECAIILDLVPCLEPIMGPKQVESKANSVEASGRQMEAFKNVMRAICTKDRPLVLFFDDVQFSDTCSLSLLEALVSDAKNEGVVCMVAMGPEKPICDIDKLMQGFSDAAVHMTTVELVALNEETTNMMVADILHVDREISAPMTAFLHHYTQGNALFLIELLNLMYANGVLTFEEQTRTWNYDEDKIDCVYDCKDFRSLIRSKISSLSQPVKEMLKAAACIGTRIDIKFLDVVMSAPVIRHMHMAVSSGLVVPIDVGTYRFATNGVREAAYSLIPHEERDTFHLAVGRKLWRGFSEEDLKKHQSVVLGQMKLGAKSTTSKKERNATAALCLTAAERAFEWSMFPAAAESLDFGLSLLGDRSWRDQYDLTLALHSTAAEVGYTLGDFSKAEERVEAILSNARVFDDTFDAYSVKINILSATAKIQEATDVGLEVLKKIGEPMPSSPCSRYVKREYIRSRRLMKSKSIEMLLRLPIMTDHRKAATMQIINLLALPAIFGRPCLLPVLAMRAARITVEHGLCNLSSVAFGLYGMTLAACGEAEEATRYGELALQLLERFDAKQWLPRVHVCVYGCIFGWTKDLRTCIGPLGRGFDVGVETGDVEYAFLNANLRSIYMFCVGTPLPVVKEEFDKLTEAMVTSKQNTLLLLHRSMIYMIEGFMDADTKKAMDQLMQAEQDTLESGFMYQCWVGFKKLLLAYVMCDYGRAVKETDTTQCVDMLPVATIDVSLVYLFDALARLAYCKQTGKNKRKTLATARKRMATMEKFAKVNPGFCLGLLYFMKAEVASLTGKHDEATNQYLSCVALLGRTEMVSVHAMASERAGRYMLERGKTPVAKEYFCESQKLFEEWGAKGKSNALQKEIAVVFGKEKC